MAFGVVISEAGKQMWPNVVSDLEVVVVVVVPGSVILNGMLADRSHQQRKYENKSQTSDFLV